MNIKIALVIFFSFLTVGILTLPHYGINWDTINHLPKGQAFLHFFLTGKKDYKELPKWQPYFQNPSSLGVDTNLPPGQQPKRSFYKSNPFSFRDILKIDGHGHPPLSDILSSLFNVILFEKLGLINDIDAYRVYGIFLAAALVGLIYFWVARVYGKFAGFIAAVSLSLYPLFWSEAHFNTQKDIPETVYWSFLLFSVWCGITRKNYKWVLMTGVFLGLALGTKFNVLFIPLIVIPWLVVFIVNKYIGKRFSIKEFILKNRKYCLSILLSPFLGIAIFIGSWPYLWSDLFPNLKGVFDFYETIGFTSSINTNFLGPWRINTFPIQWIIFTTPPVILFFSIVGILSAVFRFRQEKDKISLLFLLWLVLPILRITWPGTTVYGGVRQIMEYTPALALFAGLGGQTVYSLLKRRFNKLVVLALIISLFIPHLLILVKMHPNENVYFNFLIGGLGGAKDKKLPFWGNSFGAPYRQGVIWLNNNVPLNGKVAFVRELMPNIPVIWIRPDINFHNSYRSGYLQKGEYAIGLTYQGTKDASYYDGYLEMFLKPVYEVKVDGVGILKIWKNEREYLKIDTKEEVLENVILTKDEKGLTFDLGEVKKLSRLEIEYDERDCNKLKSGVVQLSINGKDFGQQWGALPGQWRVAALGEQPQNGSFIEPFLGQEAKVIRLVLSPSDTCLKNVKEFKVYHFLNL